MGIINRDNALALVTGVDNSDLNRGLSEAERRIDSYERSAVNAGRSISNAFDLKQNIEIQKKAIADLEKQYAQAKAALEGLGNNVQPNHRFSDKEMAEMAKQYNAAKKLMQEVRKELDAEKNKLQELEKQEKQLDNTRQRSAVSYMSQMRQLRQQMQDLAMQGKSDTDEYRKLEEQLGRVGTAFNRVRGEQRLLTTAGDSQLAGMIQGITGLAGAFTAGQGVASLFVKDTERLAAIQTKLQAAMSITMGLQSVANTLHTTSAFRITTVTKATQLWTTANYSLGKSFIRMGASANVAKVASAGLLSLGIGAVVVGISLLIKKHQEWKKQQEETIRLNKIVSDSLKSASLEGSKSAQRETTALNILYKASQNSTKSIKERTKATKEIQRLYPDYFGNLSKEEIMAGKGAAAYNKLTSSILAAAKARAAADKITENQSKLLDLEAQKAEKEAEKEKNKETLKLVSNTKYDAYSQGQTQLMAHSAGALKSKNEKLDKEISNINKETDKLDEANKKLAENINASDLLFEGSKSTKGSSKSDESAAEKARKSNDEQEKFLRDQSRKVIDIQQETSQARVNALRDGADKELEQIKLNHEKELEQLKRNKEDTLQTLIDNEKKKFYDDSKNKNKTFDSSSVQLSKEVEDYFASIESYTKKRQGNDITQFYDDTFDKVLEEYRTFEEKQNKIALKYIDLRSKAMESGNLQMLEQINKAETKEISSLNLEDFKDKVNWEQVFGDLDKVSTRALIDLRDKLRSYLESAGDSISIQDLKAVSEAIDNIDIKLADKQPLAELKSGYEGYKLAIEDVVKAKEKLNKLEEKTPEYVAATKELEVAESKRNASLVKMSKATNEIGRKGAEIVNAGKDIVDMLESFGVRMPEQVSRSLDGIGQIMSGLESIDLTRPFSIITGSIKMITGLGKTISGALGLGKGADYKRYNAMKEQYDKLNAVWDELINKKKEYISISYGDEAVKAGKEAEALIQKSVESSRTLGREFLNSGASAGSSSKGVRQRKNMSSEGWEQLEQWKKSNNISNDLYGSIKGGRMTGLFDLTAEQLEKLKEEAPTFWAKLHGETQEYLNNIISGAEKIEDIHKSVKEQLTQISFDSFRNSFLDTLADMTSDSQTFANNFQKQLQNSILNSLMAKKYDDKIKSLYDRWASYGDGDLSDYEYEALKKEQEQIVNDMLADREKYKDAFKWNSSDDVQGIKGIAASVTQDSANELNANFYALRQSVNDIRNINKQNQDYLKVQNVFVSDIKDAVQGYKQVFSDQLEYQRQIASNTYTTTVLLKEIRDNGLIIKK